MSTTFFSGFSFQNEAEQFKTWLEPGAYSVAGFSYGAIEAFEYVRTTRRRIDRLQLFSPAFFQTKNERFRTLQLRAFDLDKAGYMGKFLQNAFAPYEIEKVERRPASAEELKRLLEYQWDADAVREVTQQGVRVEVYLGAEDRIIDSAAARAFFTPLTNVIWINKANHFLKDH